MPVSWPRDMMAMVSLCGGSGRKRGRGRVLKAWPSDDVIDAAMLVNSKDPSWDLQRVAGSIVYTKWGVVMQVSIGILFRSRTTSIHVVMYRHLCYLHYHLLLP